MGQSSWVHLEFEEIVRETDRALLVRLDGGEETWIPRSVIADGDDYSEGDCDGTISVQEWFAEKENLA